MNNWIILYLYKYELNWLCLYNNNNHNNDVLFVFTVQFGWLGLPLENLMPKLKFICHQNVNILYNNDITLHHITACVCVCVCGCTHVMFYVYVI